uniref:Kell metallo-endopeptidase (Kell blood group) n=1 Tax=Paramormyrops kingsleyae TaxID=1676925 RepID=A0A3B3QVN8_9TELE|nr:kell blood group glycoprotein-like isoform X2 [Paramormyrops kingsleyae]
MIDESPLAMPQSVQKSRLTTKQLQILLVLGSSIIVLLLLGLCLHFISSGAFDPWAVGINTASPRQAPPPCLSQACLKAAERLSASADPFAQPCDHFLFNCGPKEVLSSGGREKRRGEAEGQSGRMQGERWSNRGRNAGRARETETFAVTPSVQSAQRTAVLQLIREILESTDRPGSEDSAEQKARRFYSTCMDTERIEKAGPEPFLKLIEKLGGWAVFGKWNRRDFNATLSLLMKDYFTFPFFNIYVGSGPSDNNTGHQQKYIQIDQPDIQIPVEWISKKPIPISRKKKVQDLRHFLLSRVQLLSLLGVPSSSTSQHMGMFIQLSSELAQFTSPLLYRLQHQLLYHRLTVGELQAQAPAIDWLGCLQASFHPLTVRESDVVYLHNLPYITHMSKIIRKWWFTKKFSHSDTLHTFMILSLLNTVIPALDSRFFEIQRNFSAVLGNMEEVVPRWSHCVQQTEIGFNTVLQNLIRERVGVAEAEDLMHSVYSSLKSELADLPWRNQNPSILHKVMSLSPRLSPYTEFTTKEKLDEQYSNVVIIEGDYFSNYLQSLILQRKNRNKVFSHMSISNTLAVTPHLTGNEIHFPLGMFLPPLFHASFPRAVNYAVLGMLMAKDILHLLMPHIQAQSQAPETVSQCVWALYGNLTGGPDRAQQAPITPAQRWETWAQYSALQIALQAYQDSLTQLEDTSLSGLYHNRLFFAAFLQVSCDFELHYDHLPFADSFLLATICMKSDFCPQSMICSHNIPEHFKQSC